jgi:PAS domain S-box-containing protein
MRWRTALLVICGALTLWLTDPSLSTPETRRVVLLFDERPGLPGMAAVEAGFTKTLQSNFPGRLEIYHEAMDLSRFGTNDYQARLRDFLAAKYADKKIHVAIAVMGPALDFLLIHGEAIFPGTPIIFCGVDRREVGDRSLPPHVSGILINRRFKPTVDAALGLHPDVQRIVVVAGTSEFDRRVLEQAKKELSAFEDRVTITYLTELPLHEVLKEVSHLPPRTIMLFTTLFQDGAGHPFVPHDALERISAAASAPVYGSIDQYLGRGIVGGSLYSMARQGPETAKLALELFNGTKPTRPSLLEPELSQLQFDWGQLQRWGIDASKLPAASQIQFRPLSVWEQYRWQLTSVSIALLLQLAIITWLLIERHWRRAAQISLRDSEERMTFAATSAGVGLWQYDIPANRLWSSLHCRTMFGLRPDEPLTTAALLASVHPEDRPVAKASIRAATFGTLTDATSEFRVKQPNGQAHWVQAIGRTDFDAKGMPARVSGIFRDITAVRIAQDEAQQLLQRLLSVQDDERQRIAQELHDSTAQHLTAVGLNLIALRGSIGTARDTSSTFDDIETSVQAAAKELRAFTYLLHPPTLAQEGLEVTLDRYVDGLRRRTGLDIALRLSPGTDRLSQEFQEAILRIVQEALANAHRHGSASRVLVHLRIVDETLHLVIKDNGRGLPTLEQGDDQLPLGLGVTGMIARARRLGGKFDIRSSRSGTIVHVLLPTKDQHMQRAAE